MWRRDGVCRRDGCVKRDGCEEEGRLCGGRGTGWRRDGCVEEGRIWWKIRIHVISQSHTCTCTFR